MEKLQRKLRDDQEELTKLEAAILEEHQPFLGPSASELVLTSRVKVEQLEERDQKLELTLNELADRSEKLESQLFLLSLPDDDDKIRAIRIEEEDLIQKMKKGKELRAFNFQRLEASRKELAAALDLQRKRNQSKFDQEARIKTRSKLQKELAGVRFQLDILEASRIETESLQLLHSKPC